ncbi:hypothetical protein MRX96_052016 [Rhipicephalus microplus]
MASLEPLDPPREQDSSIDAERARHARTGELLRAIPSSSSRATGGAGTIFSFSPLASPRAARSRGATWGVPFALMIGVSETTSGREAIESGEPL